MLKSQRKPRRKVKQACGFEFKGSERINFRDKQDNLQFFFDVDYAYSRADSANRQKVERVFYNKNGKNYLLVGVPWNWLKNTPDRAMLLSAISFYDIGCLIMVFHFSGAARLLSLK